MNADFSFGRPHGNSPNNTTAAKIRPRGFLGQINLEMSDNQPGFWVDMERFLHFSFEIAEEMADLVSRYQADSAATCPSDSNMGNSIGTSKFGPDFRATHGKAAWPK